MHKFRAKIIFNEFFLKYPEGCFDVNCIDRQSLPFVLTIFLNHFKGFKLVFLLHSILSNFYFYAYLAFRIVHNTRIRPLPDFFLSRVPLPPPFPPLCPFRSKDRSEICSEVISLKMKPYIKIFVLSRVFHVFFASNGCNLCLFFFYCLSFR